MCIDWHCKIIALRCILWAFKRASHWRVADRLQTATQAATQASRNKFPFRSDFTFSTMSVCSLNQRAQHASISSLLRTRRHVYSVLRDRLYHGNANTRSTSRSCHAFQVPPHGRFRLHPGHGKRRPTCGAVIRPKYRRYCLCRPEESVAVSWLGESL